MAAVDAGSRLAGRVYPSGLSRGETPPQEIPTMGAAGRRTLLSEDWARKCPFYRDEREPFSARSEGLYLEILRPRDVPGGPKMYAKDYDRSLITEDVLRAQPVLAHPTTGNVCPVPWKDLDKPEMPNIAKSQPRDLYPPVDPARPVDLSLKTEDIELAQPRSGLRVDRRTRDGKLMDPLTPRYQFLSSQAAPAPVPKSSGRNPLDVSDIERTAPRPRVPRRREYGDPLKCEAEFRSAGREAAHSTTLARTQALPQQTTAPAPPFSCREEAFRPPQAAGRVGDALEPRYCVPLASGPDATSLHCRWSEEYHAFGDAKPATEPREIGPVPGSEPRTRIRDNGEPFLNLETRDIEGARAAHKVAGLPHSMYGPMRNRPLPNASLHTADIEGAQADTLTRNPRMRLERSRLAVAGLGTATPRNASTTEERPARPPTERG